MLLIIFSLFHKIYLFQYSFIYSYCTNLPSSFSQDLFSSSFRFRISTSSTLKISRSVMFISRERFFHRGEESSFPSAPFLRSPPLASNFNYTVPIGGNGWGDQGRWARGGLERREWLDARPTYQDNGFHRSRCSVYTNPWQGVALDFHCIALSLTGVESERARVHAHARLTRARALTRIRA